MVEHFHSEVGVDKLPDGVDAASVHAESRDVVTGRTGREGARCPSTRTRGSEWVVDSEWRAPGTAAGADEQQLLVLQRGQGAGVVEAVVGSQNFVPS